MGIAGSSRTWRTHTGALEVRRSTGELAGAGRKILKRLFRAPLWLHDRPSRPGWLLKLLVRSAARILPSLFNEGDDLKPSNSVSSAENVALKSHSENFSRDEAAHSMELLRSRTFDLSDDRGHATLNAAGVKFCQKVSGPSEKEDIVDPIKKLRTPLPFRPTMPKRISFYHGDLVHESQKCMPLVASGRPRPSCVPTFPLPFSKGPLDLKGVSSTYQNLQRGSSKCAGRNCSSISEGGGWSIFTGGSNVHPQSRRMDPKNSVEEITQKREMCFSRSKPLMGTSEGKDSQEVFSGPSTSKFCNKYSSLSLQHRVCKADASDLFQVPKFCTADSSRLFHVPKSQGHSQGESMFKPFERAKASDQSFGFAFPVSRTTKAFYKRDPMPAISSSQVVSRAYSYLGHSRRESIIKRNEGVEVSYKGFILDLLVSTAPKTFYKQAPISTLSSSQADNRVHAYQGHSCSQLVIKPHERVEIADKCSSFYFPVSTASKTAFYEPAPLHNISSSQTDSKEFPTSSDHVLGFTFPVPLTSVHSEPPPTPQFKFGFKKIDNSSERVDDSDKGFNFAFPVSTALEAFKESTPIHAIISSQADGKVISTGSDNDLDFAFPVPLALVHSEPPPTPQFKFGSMKRDNSSNEGLDTSDEDFDFAFSVSTAPRALYEPALMHDISSSQADRKTLPASFDNELDFTFPVAEALVPSEPPLTPPFKFGSKSGESSSDERVDASDKDFDFVFSGSMAQNALYEPTAVPAINSSQADSKELPTSSENDFDFSFPIPLAPVYSEPPPTPQFKFRDKKRDDSSKERVDDFDKNCYFVVHVSSAPKALYEPAPMHTIISSQADNKALPTSSVNDLEFTFPVLVHSEPVLTPQFKFGSKKRDSLSFKSVAESAICFCFICCMQ